MAWGRAWGEAFWPFTGRQERCGRANCIAATKSPADIEEPATDAVVGGHGWGRSVNDYLDLLDGKISNPIPASKGANIVSVCAAALDSIRTKRPQTPHWF